jgi:hypothetical protein
MDYYQAVATHKLLPVEKLQADFRKLQDWSATENQLKYCGNKIVYHYFLVEMMKVVCGNSQMSIEEILKDPETLEFWLNVANRKKKQIGSLASRLFETIRQTVPLFAFKASTAKYIYKTFEAKRVLDPCAGWPGRLLGAASLGIPYTGFDTNLGLQEPYKKMIADLKFDPGKYVVKHQSCLEVDYSQYQYDLVLSSPPYYNLEKYPGGQTWSSEKEFYQEFLILLLQKLQAGIQKPGWICLNISRDMYKKLTDIYKFRVCNREIELKQQKRYKKLPDLIYCWEI